MARTKCVGCGRKWKTPLMLSPEGLCLLCKEKEAHDKKE
jgi:hypothetical protein